MISGGDEIAKIDLGLLNQGDERQSNLNMEKLVKDDQFNKVV